MQERLISIPQTQMSEQKAGRVPRNKSTGVLRVLAQSCWSSGASASAGRQSATNSWASKGASPERGSRSEDAAVHNCREGLIILISEQAEFEMEMRGRFPCHATRQLE